MSATLAQSIAWDTLPDEAKRASVLPHPELVPGRTYTLPTTWAVFGMRCLDPDLPLFRVESVSPSDTARPDDSYPCEGWTCTIQPKLLACLKPTT